MPIYKMQGKKDGRQRYRVRINYTDKNGKSHQIDRVAYGAAEAAQLEARLRAETAETTPETSNGIRTINDLYRAYIAAKKNEVRQTTLDKSTQIIERDIIPILGDVKLSRLSKAVLQDWKNQISDKPTAVKTKQHIYAELRAMLNYAEKMEYIQRNPLPAIGNFKDANFTKPQDQLHFYTPEQFKQYISAAEKSAQTITDWCFYTFFCMAFYTGMRKGEINALKWADIDGDIIHVRRSIAQKLKGDDLETPPKNRSSYRDLQIPTPLMQILHDHKARLQANPAYTEDWRVCGGIKCLRDTTIEKRNTTYAKAAGLPHIRIHDFRHTHASLLINEGINIHEIARRLGHSNIDMTLNTYGHLYPREEERALNVLNKIQIQ